MACSCEHENEHTDFTNEALLNQASDYCFLLKDPAPYSLLLLALGPDEEIRSNFSFYNYMINLIISAQRAHFILLLGCPITR